MEIVLILHNIRSTCNVASILRTADGFSVDQIIYSGFTPAPIPHSTLLPHLAEKVTNQIHKTALGAESLVSFEFYEDINDWIKENEQTENLPIVALEQAKNSIMLPEFQPPEKFALLLGEEVHGITPELLENCQFTVEIPMFGQKESFNVSVATGIALFGMNFPVRK